MLEVLFCWIILFWTCLALGRTVWHTNIATFFDLGLMVLVGLGTLQAALLAVSIVVPIDVNCAIAIVCVAACCTWIWRADLLSALKLFWSQKWLLLFLMPVTAISSLQSVTWYDTNLYHFNAVKWLREFGTVLGLANVHERLGYINGMHNIAAIVESAGVPDKSAHIVLGFLLLLAAMIIYGAGIASPRLRTFSWCALALWAARIGSEEVSSHSSDLPILWFTILLILLALVGSPLMTAPLMILGSLMITTKFPSAVPVGLVLVYQLMRLRRISGPSNPKAKVWPSALVAIIGLIAFVVRHVLTSGYIPFPLPWARTSWEWTVDPGMADNAYSWARSWAHMPGVGPHEWMQTPYKQWFLNHWWPHFLQTFEARCLLVATIALMFTLARWRRVQIDEEDSARPYVSLLWIIALGLASWFVSGPDPRFGTGLFGALLCLSVHGLIGRLQTNGVKLVFVIALFLFAITGWPMVARHDFNLPQFFAAPRDLYANVIPQTNQPPAFANPVYRPQGDDRCGNSPLPCSPYGGFIRLRNPTRGIEGGFLPAGTERGYLEKNPE